jgi:hypothetical protein
MSDLDALIAALATQMSASLLALSQDGMTESLTDHAEALLERVSDLATLVTDPQAPTHYAGWAPSGSSTIPDYPPPGLL